MNFNKKNKYFYYIIFIAAFIIFIQACKTYYFRSNYTSANELIHSTENLKTKPFLKAHFKNGNICILKDTWEVDSLRILGHGTLYDFNRKKISEGSVNLNIDSVAIFETNTSLKNAENGRLTAMTILTSLDVALGLLCISNPKACFGSCPTFYINENDNFHYADAEGFSNAIAPSLEYGDIDALNCRRVSSDSTFRIIMKNEALETHCLNEVKLLAYPISEGEKVYQSPSNSFYVTKSNFELMNASGPEGDILDLIKEQDRIERFSFSDEENLSSKEELILDFNTNESNGDLGLIVNFRQTLMTTYFIYSAMGYMGNEVGDMFAKIETEKDLYAKLNNGIKNELGNIEIYIWNTSNGVWEFRDGFYETGPIAFNNQIIPIKGIKGSDNLKVKIRMNKGLWRIDNVALTHIEKEVEPLVLMPTSLYKGKLPDSVGLEKLFTQKDYLISMPGNSFRFNFNLPKENEHYDLFLYSKGYYLEWMRNSWIKDKNLLALKQMLEDPKEYLKDQTESYKLYEKNMEEEFWNSKIESNILGYEIH